MIATKKAKLIRKHLGINTPDWIVSNCIKLLNEYEEIEWCNVPETQANGADTGQHKCHIQRVNNLVCDCDNPEIHINKKTGREWCFNCWQKLKQTDVIKSVCECADRHEEGIVWSARTGRYIKCKCQQTDC